MSKPKPKPKPEQIPYILKAVFTFAKKSEVARAIKVIRQALKKEFGYPVFEGDPQEERLNNESRYPHGF